MSSKRYRWKFVNIDFHCSSYYCDSDEDPHSGGAQKDIPPRGHAKIRLNLARTYGRTQIWNPTSGVRELVQNWFDGILQKYQVEADDVVVVEKTRSKKSENCNIPLASTDPQPKKIVFSASIPLQSNGGKPPCVAQVIYTDNGNPLRRKLELINFDVALLRKNLLMGQTSKQEDANAIGGHGEGMKVGKGDFLFPSINDNCHVMLIQTYRDPGFETQ